MLALVVEGGVSHAFTSPGSHDYDCSVHPHDMQGSWSSTEGPSRCRSEAALTATSRPPSQRDTAEGGPGERKLVHGFAVFEGIAFLGALILFLVIIGNTLVRINDNLGSTASSANAVDASAKTLPGLVDSITNSLTAIDNDVKPVKGQLDSINSGLGTTQNGLGVADSNLSSTNQLLGHIEGNLTLADQYAHRVAVALIADDAGLAQVIARVVDLINAAGGIHGDAANIGTAAVPINDHLHSISSKANNLCRAVSILPGSSC